MTLLSNILTALIAASALVAPVASHDHSEAGIAKRAAAELKARNGLSRCNDRLRARELDEYRMQRRDQLIEEHLARRRLEKREWIPKAQAPPHTDGNNTCVLAPEAVVGPYYLHDMLIRKDIRKGEGEKGIPLLLDLQFVDVNTCDPIRNAMIDVWHCNSTGKYSGYAIENTSGETFLRGLQPTDRHGIMHIITSVPGWYTGRATHIHIAAHTNGTVNRKKKIYEGGQTRHVGQVFFPEELLEKIDISAPYNKNTAVKRLRNANDFIYQEATKGYNGEVEWHQISRNFRDGIVAFIKVGIDPSADYDMDNKGFPGFPPGGFPSGMPFPSGGFPSGFPSGFPTNFPMPTGAIPSGVFPPGVSTPVGSPAPTASATAETDDVTETDDVEADPAIADEDLVIPDEE